MKVGTAVLLQSNSRRSKFPGAYFALFEVWEKYVPANLLVASTVPCVLIVSELRAPGRIPISVGRKHVLPLKWQRSVGLRLCEVYKLERFFHCFHFERVEVSWLRVRKEAFEVP